MKDCLLRIIRILKDKTEEYDNEKIKLFLKLSVFCAAISSLVVITFIFIENSNVLRWIAATVFWVFVIMESLLMYMADKIRKKEKNGKISGKISGKAGVLTFLNTKEGSIADMILILSLILLIIFGVFNISRIITFILLSIVIFSFNMHCIANGKNYRYILKIKRRTRK